MMIQNKSIKHYSLLLLAFFLILSTSSLATAQSKKRQKKKSKKKNIVGKKRQLSSEDRQRVETLLFEGLIQKIKENYEGATEIFKEALKIDPSNDAIMYELTKLYFAENKQEEALFYARSATEIAPTNKWYQFLYAETLSFNSKYAEAAKVYEKLVAANPQDYEYYFDLGYMFFQAGQYEKAIEAYDELEKVVGIDERISEKKKRLYLKLNKPEKAAKEVQSLIDNDPDNARYYQMLAELYAANGMEEKAFKVYEKMLVIAPNNPYAQLSLANYYYKKGDSEAYFTNLQKAFEHPDLPIDIKARILSEYAETSKQDAVNQKQIFDLVKIVTKVHEEEALAHAVYGDLLYVYDKKAEALEEFKKAAKLENNRFEVWQQILIIQYELADFTALAQESKEVIKLFPNQPMPYYFNGLSEIQLSNHEKALKSLKKGVLVSGNNKDLKAQMHALLGQTYNSLKDYKKSDKHYTSALEINPNNPNALNNYSYYLSLRENDLERAAAMSKKSNDLAPGNPSFQDTYAWILYKQKKYKDAKIWLEKSLSSGGEANTTILEHYGDVLYQLNDTDKAVEQWQKAKELGSDSKTIDKKIQDKKLYE